jgi:hypothetical protein
MLQAIRVFLKALKDKQGAFLYLNPPKTKTSDASLKLLFLLQKHGRLIDFLQEDLSAYSDAQVGAAARKVQGDCKKVLNQYLTLRPQIEAQEGSQVTVSSDYDPQAIKVVGKVKGQAPYTGILRHKGWKVVGMQLPGQLSESPVLCAAEVEVV